MNDSEKSPNIDNDSDFNGSIFSNSYYQVPFWYDSIGFRNNTLNSFSTSEAGECKIAEDFLINSKNFSQNKEFQFSVGAFFDDAHLMMVYNQSDPWGNSRNFDYSNFKKVKLGEGIKLPVSFGEVIKNRRSKREYTGDSMKIDYLSSILRCASGVNGFGTTRLSSDSEVQIAFRTVASGGGLYPNDIVIVALNVNGLSKGIYQYIPRIDDSGDFLILLNNDVNEIIEAFPHNDISMKISNSSAIFMVSTNPWKTMRKYGSRGLRFIFLEAGAMCQNIHLACSALGIGSCDFGAYIDADVDRVLGFDGISQTIIHTVITGII